MIVYLAARKKSNKRRRAVIVLFAGVLTNSSIRFRSDILLDGTKFSISANRRSVDAILSVEYNHQYKDQDWLGSDGWNINQAMSSGGKYQSFYQKLFHYQHRELSAFSFSIVVSAVKCIFQHMQSACILFLASCNQQSYLAGNPTGWMAIIAGVYIINFKYLIAGGMRLAGGNILSLAPEPYLAKPSIDWPIYITGEGKSYTGIMKENHSISASGENNTRQDIRSYLQL